MYCSSLQQRLDAGLLVHSEEEEVEFYEQEINLEKQEVNTLHEAHGHPQPDVVRVVLPSRQEALVSDVRVSERNPWVSLRLRGYGSKWDHLSGELTPSEKATLDQGEWQAEQVKNVYREITPTLPQDHLQFDAVSVVEWAVSETCLRVEAVVSWYFLCRTHWWSLALTPRWTWERSWPPAPCHTARAEGSSTPHSGKRRTLLGREVTRRRG